MKYGKLLAAGAGALAAAHVWVREQRRINLAEKNVLVTGGSRGLGLALARQLIQAGAAVAIAARDPHELADAAALLRQEQPGSTVATLFADVTDPDADARMVAEAEQALGPLDILINNAGVILVGPLEELTEADFEQALQTHFWGVYHTVQAALPGFRTRGGGRIVNIASIGGRIAVPHLLPYCASKFALVGFSEGLRAELLKDRIYVTTVCPGLMRTGSPRNAWFRGRHEAEYAWFKISDSLPGISMSANAAAAKILRALCYGDADVTLGIPAQIGALLHGVAPGLVADVLGWVNTLLPPPAINANGTAIKKGRDSETALTESPLTALTQQAAAANNE